MTLHNRRRAKVWTVNGFDFDVPTGFPFTFDLHHFNMHGFAYTIERLTHGPLNFFHLFFTIQAAVLGIQCEKDAVLLIDA